MMGNYRWLQLVSVAQSPVVPIIYRKRTVAHTINSGDHNIPLQLLASCRDFLQEEYQYYCKLVVYFIASSNVNISIVNNL